MYIWTSPLPESAGGTEMVSAAEHPHLVTQMAFQYRFVPALLRAKEALTHERSGQNLFRTCLLSSCRIYRSQQTIYMAAGCQTKWEGRALFLGSHIIDLTHDICWAILRSAASW